MSDAPSNPFDGEGEFLALTNDLGQYSLWPGFADVPAGWIVAHGPCTRQDALDRIGACWTELAPAPR